MQGQDNSSESTSKGKQPPISGKKPRRRRRWGMREPALKMPGRDRSSIRRQLMQAADTFESDPTGPAADFLLKRINSIDLRDVELDDAIQYVAQRLVSAVERIQNIPQKMATAGAVARTISYLASQAESLELSSHLSFTALKLNPAEQWTEVSRVIADVEELSGKNREETGKSVAEEIRKLRDELDEDSWKRVSKEILENLQGDSVVVSELAKMIETDEPQPQGSPPAPAPDVNEESVVRKWLEQRTPPTPDHQGSVVHVLHRDRNGRVDQIRSVPRAEYERDEIEAAEAKENVHQARADAQQAQEEKQRAQEEARRKQQEAQRAQEEARRKQEEARQAQEDAGRARRAAEQAAEQTVQLQRENVNLVSRLLKKKNSMILTIGAVALGIAGASLYGYHHVNTSPKVVMMIKDKKFKLADLATEYPKKITPKKVRKHLNSMVLREHIGLLDINQQADILHGVVQRITYMPDTDAWFPTEPGETLKNKNGNCKSIAVLLASLLESIRSKTVLFFEWTREEGHVFVGVRISKFTKDAKARKDAELALKIYYKERAAKRAEAQVAKNRKKYRTKKAFDEAVRKAKKRAEAEALRRLPKIAFREIEPGTHSHISKHAVGTYLVFDAAVKYPENAFVGSTVTFDEVPNTFPVESVPGKKGKIPILL